MEGWSEDITRCTELAELPVQARNYIKKIEEILEIPVGIISVGPERNQTIIAEPSKVVS